MIVKFKDTISISGLGKLFLMSQKGGRAMYCDSSDREYELTLDDKQNLKFRRIDNRSRLAVGSI